MNPYLGVSQVVENSAAYYNKEKIQVIGTVANGSVTYENTFMVFNLIEKESVIKVNYTGTPRPPQGFQEGNEVVVIGKLVSLDTLEGHDMLVKCPSKYEGGGESLLTDPTFLTALLLGSGAIVGMVVSIAWKRKQHKA